MNRKDFIRRSRLQEAINKFGGTDPESLKLWVKDKTNIDLRPTQILHAHEIVHNHKIVCLAPPRFGKSVVVELMDLRDSALNAGEDGRIWAPKEDQAKESLKIQREAIARSELLTSFIARENGKVKNSSTGYKFMNGSNWKVFGIYGNFEGENASILRLEEYDDLDIDIVKDRVMARGSGANANGMPTRVRITGTIQAGKGNIYEAFQNKAYFVCKLFGVEAGLKLGYYDKDIIEQARADLTAEAFDRIWNLVFTEAKNFIPEKYIRMASSKGLELKLGLIDPAELTSPYIPEGMVFAGLDMGSSGEQKTSSKYVASFIEVIGGKRLFLFAKEWPATENPKIVAAEFCDLWEKLNVSYGKGDALKADLIRDINDTLYARRLIRQDVNLLPSHSQSTWPDWDFGPVWNTGGFKWLHGAALQKDFMVGNFIFPYIEKNDDRDAAIAMRKMQNVIANIKEHKKSVSQKYPSLDAINKILGDDYWDSLIMAYAAALERYKAKVDFGLVETGGNRVFNAGRMGIKVDRDFAKTSKTF